MKHHQTLRRGLYVMLSLVMCLILLPLTALAEETEIVTIYDTTPEEAAYTPGDVTISGDQLPTISENEIINAEYESEGVAINDTNFPDVNFREFVSSCFDIDKDNTLSADEIAAVKKIDCAEKSIASLKGIEYFSALTNLRCYRNALTTLDVSENTNLMQLFCYSNGLTKLVLGENTNLKTLYCDNNNLPKLDVSKNTGLTGLICKSNSLTTLDVGYNIKLTSLDCGDNKLKTLDVSQNTELTTLKCYSNALTTLDVGNNTELTNLQCYTNQLTTLNVGNNTRLASLDCQSNQLITLNVNNNTRLTELKCQSNELTALDVGENPSLKTLYCYSNRLKTLDVANNTKLTELKCYSNALKTLDVSRNTALKTLHCYKNQLTELKLGENTNLTTLSCEYNYLAMLDVCKNTELTSLKCSENSLISLDVSQNKKLTSLNCDSNNLTTLDVTENTALKTLECYGNALTTLDVSKNIALAYLDCQRNRLTSLDVSNTALGTLNTGSYNTYEITLDENRSFDLSTLPAGFDVSKVISWTGGTVVGNTLTFKPGVAKVTYTYDCGRSMTGKFMLDTTPKYTVTAYGLYGNMGIAPGATFIKDYAGNATVFLNIGARDGYTLDRLELDGITEEKLTWTKKEEESSERTVSFDMPENAVTVIAIWKKAGQTSRTKTITLNATGGIVAPTSVETGKDGKLDSLPAPSREGYIFDGWYTAAAEGTEVTTETVFDVDTTIYAYWTEAITVTFDANGGNVTPASTQIGIGSKLGSLPTPNREGYIFEGWYTAAAEGTEVTTETVFDLDTTIYAHWTQNVSGGDSGFGSDATVTAPKEGDWLTDSKTKLVYKVTKSGTTGGTMEFIKTTNTKAKTIAIPDEVTVDGITYKVTSIAAGALKNKKTVTTVTIGKYVTSIGTSAFSGCSKLKKVTIGKSATAIGAKAFYKCTSLTKITIPAKVKKIGKQAFYGCKKLKTITIKTTKLTGKNVGSSAFKGIHAKATIKVPKRKLTSYKKLLKAKGVSSKAKIKIK